MYYRCEMDTMDIGFNLIPRLYGCPFDFEFNGIDCEDPELRMLDIHGLCLKIGSFSFPNDCKQYYNCYRIRNIPSVERCSHYKRFDQIQKECVYFDGIDCDDE